MQPTLTHEAPANLTEQEQAPLNGNLTEQDLAQLQLKLAASNSEAAVKNNLRDAFSGYYQGINRLGSIAFLVIAWGAKCLVEHKPSNVKVSEMIRECSVKGEQVPLRTMTEAGPGGKGTHSYTKAGAHPFKQEGKVWRDLFIIEAVIGHGMLIPDKWPTNWPAAVYVGGVPFTSPAKACQARNGVRRVHIAYMNAIKPTVTDMRDLLPWQARGQVLSGLKVAKTVRVTGRFLSKEATATTSSGRYQKKNVKAAETPHGAYGIIMGLLHGTRDAMTDAERDDIVLATTNAVFPKNLPLASKVEDAASGQPETEEQES